MTMAAAIESRTAQAKDWSSPSRIASVDIIADLSRAESIWRELEAVLKAHGVHNYSIYLHPETRQLFGYAEIEDEARWNAIADTDVCRRWWVSMSPLMPSHADHRPASRDLTEVFRLDRP